jgi:hypothetical protein
MFPEKRKMINKCAHPFFEIQSNSVTTIIVITTSRITNNGYNEQIKVSSMFFSIITEFDSISKHSRAWIRINCNGTVEN